MILPVAGSGLKWEEEEEEACSSGGGGGGGGGGGDESARAEQQVKASQLKSTFVRARRSRARLAPRPSAHTH